MYSTYFGGTGDDYANAIDTDSAGNVYVTGSTPSINFPVKPGGYSTTINGGYDVFVSKLKLDPTGPTPDPDDLLYSTFLGGSAGDFGQSIKVDSSGNAYVTGWTASTDFPTTPYAFDGDANGYDDVFVTELDEYGSSLLYSTYVGGSGSDWGFSIDVDSSDRVYVVGATDSDDLFIIPGSYDTTYSGDYDAFLFRIDLTVPIMDYLTYLGYQLGDFAYSVKVDSLGYACVAGYSWNFPTTEGAYDTTYNGGAWDAFVAKLSTDSSGPPAEDLIYSTYLGGSADDLAVSIALDSANNAYVTGHTSSADFPITQGAYDNTYDGTIWGTYDVFVAKLELDPSGPTPDPSDLLYASYLGGSDDDRASSIAVDTFNTAFLTGFTYSGNFPTTLGAYDLSYNGGLGDAFLAKMNPDDSGVAPDLGDLIYSTYLGTDGRDESTSVKACPFGCVYLAGWTTSNAFPTTNGAFQIFSSNTEAFLANFSLEPSGPDQLFIETSEEWGGGIYGATTTSVYAADVDEDGETEILTVGSKTVPAYPPPNVDVGVLRVWHWKCSRLTLEEEEIFALVGEDVRFNAVRAGDVDNDDDVEIVTAGSVRNRFIGSSQFQLLAWRWDGVNLVLEAELRGPASSIAYGLEVQDTEADGIPEIFISGSVYVIFVGMSGFLNIYEWDGNEYAYQAGTTWQTLATPTEGRGVSVGHLDSGVRPQVAVGGFHTDSGERRADVSVWNWFADIKVLSARMSTSWGDGGGDTAVNSIYIADSDGDYLDEVNTAGYAWKSLNSKTVAQVKVINWFPLPSTGMNWEESFPLEYSEAHSIFAADIDDDDDVEIIAAGHAIWLGTSYGELVILSIVSGQERSELWRTDGTTAAHGLFAIDVEPDGDVEILTVGIAANDRIAGVFGQLRIWNWNT